MNLLGMMSNPELMMNAADFEEKQKAAQQTNSRTTETFYPGTGKNYFHVLPVFDPSIGKFTLCFEWTEHRKFVDDRSVVCLQETHGLPCPICDAKDALFKTVFNKLPTGGKTKLIKASGLYTTSEARGAILLVQDSGEQSTDKYKRDEYIPGKVYKINYTPDPWNSLIGLTKDPDLNRRGPFWHPMNAKQIDYTIIPGNKTKNNFRKHTLQARHTDSQPIICLPDYNADEKAIGEALEEADQMVIWSRRYNMRRDDAIELQEKIKEAAVKRANGEQVEVPQIEVRQFTPEYLEKIEHAIEDAKVQAYRLINQDYTPKYAGHHYHQQHDNGPQQGGDYRSEQRNTNNSQQTNQQPTGIRPTDQIDTETGKPMCHSKGVLDLRHDRCTQGCSFMPTCDKGKQDQQQSPTVSPSEDYDPPVNVAGFGGQLVRNEEPNYPSQPATAGQPTEENVPPERKPISDIELEVDVPF